MDCMDCMDCMDRMDLWTAWTEWTYGPRGLNGRGRRGRLSYLLQVLQGHGKPEKGLKTDLDVTSCGNPRRALRLSAGRSGFMFSDRSARLRGGRA